jgi:hypothetical protein
VPRRKRRVRKTPLLKPQILKPPPVAPSFVLRYDRVHLTKSALKHGISEADIRHAENQAIKIFEYFDEANRRRIFMIGPDQSGNLLELLMAINPDSSLKIFHAMRLRTKFETLVSNQE